MAKENSELERLETEISRLKDKLAQKDSELKRIESEMDEERHAMMYMLDDVNKSVEKMESALEKLKEEKEITANLLMIAEATAHTTDVDKLMEHVVDCGHKLMKFDICLSYLWNKDTKAFVPCRACGLEHKMIPMFMTEPLDEKTGFVKEALEKREPIIISDFGMWNSEFKKDDSTLRTSHSAFTWLPDINTITAIPFIGKSDYLGLIIGIYTTSKEFTEKCKQIMQGITHQVTTALEQARLYRESTDKSMELHHRIETIQTMHEIDKSILSSLESQEILDIVTRLISRVIPCDRATVAIIDKKRRGFIYQAGFGATNPKGQFVLFEDTNTTEVIETGSPQYVSNLNDIKDLPSLEKGFLKDGFLSHIRVPLVIKEEIAGVLNIGSKRPSAFTKEDLATLEKIASQISVALQNAKLIEDLKAMCIGIVISLSSAIDAKSKWTAGHSQRVTELAIEIGVGMGLDKETLEKLRIAGLLHDVGKIGTYEAILDKPGKLDDEEFKMIKQHPSKGAEILSPMEQLQDIIPGVKHHHEFYDGRGYPDGLKGDMIPLLSRILTVADTVDAMGADRPYRKGKPMDEIIAELNRCSGTQFDPKVVEAFLVTR